MEKQLVGIEIGGTKLQVFVSDNELNIVERHKMEVGKTKNAAGIRDTISEKLLEVMNNHKPACIGIGFGGPVNRHLGKVLVSYHVEGWTNFPLCDWLSKQTGVPVVMDNDSNIAALGEANLGAGKGFSRVFYINMGSGVGGGFVIDGKLYHSSSSGEAEFGHMRLDKSGRIVEESCSGWAVDRKVRQYIQQNPESILAGLAGKAISGEARFLRQAIMKGDQGAGKIFEETMDDLAFALSHVTQLLHPDVFVLGGGLALMGEMLRKQVEGILPAYLMSSFRESVPRIRLAELGEDVVAAGALILAGQHVEIH